MLTGLLSPERVSALLRETSAALEAEEPEEGLRVLTDRFVPALADEAVLFVVGSDRKLHPRVSTAGEPGSTDHPGPEGSPTDAVPVDGSHPAAAACREGAVAFRTEDAGAVGTWWEGGAPPAEGTSIHAVALPILRRGEPVAVLQLTLRKPGRAYAPADLDRFSDLAQRISLTMENARLRKEVREARRAKSDFLSVMSHELRTPLTAVVGYADLLEAGIPGPVSDQQVRHLTRIKESAWELLELIDGILGYARWEGEDPELRVQDVRPERLVEDALRTLHADLRDKGLELVVDLEEGLPPVRTDREKATRVLFHLLSNAEKFTDTGQVRVGVSAEPDWVCFRVSDTGPGIREGEVEQIFEPFWQGERAETRTKGGTGMGLSLARRLAELVSGRIEVVSREGKGSTFTLRLPREGPQPSFP